MSRNPQFEKLLDEMRAIHEKKNQDYSSSGPYENFERCALINSWFGTDIDKAFSTLVAVKLARLGVLLSHDKAPNNESIQDSFLDLTVYCGLWGSYHRQGSELDTGRNQTFSRPLSFAMPENFFGETSPAQETSRQKKKSELSFILGNLNDEELAVLLSEARRLDMRNSNRNGRDKDAESPRKG